MNSAKIGVRKSASGSKSPPQQRQLHDKYQF